MVGEKANSITRLQKFGIYILCNDRNIARALFSGEFSGEPLTGSKQ